ncbi:MAG TPA: response regulator transcription factor [Bacteroidetes bacterium]|nr:response regulator transcription factor [Bacteroidota bacterium]
MKILICEDNKLASLVISTMLKRRDYTVEIASDGNEALEKITTGNPDLVIADIHLPYHSGLELVRYLRNEMESKIPVIIVSAFSDPHVQENAWELGISDYFVKPIDNEALIAKVDSLLK